MPYGSRATVQAIDSLSHSAIALQSGVNFFFLCVSNLQNHLNGTILMGKIQRNSSRPAIKKTQKPLAEMRIDSDG